MSLVYDTESFRNLGVVYFAPRVDHLDLIVAVIIYRIKWSGCTMVELSLRPKELWLEHVPSTTYSLLIPVWS